MEEHNFLTAKARRRKADSPQAQIENPARFPLFTFENTRVDAMEACIADHVWGLEQIVGFLACFSREAGSGFECWLILRTMKELILTLAVTMLATHTPAQQVIPPPLTLTISDFGNSQIRVITQNVPPRVPYTYIATSTDLINWTPAITNINLNGAATNVFSATNTVSFYRVVNPF